MKRLPKYARNFTALECWNRSDLNRQPRANLFKENLTGFAQTLEAITNRACSLEGVRRLDLCSGDRVMVTTRNSLYTLWAIGDSHFLVWGGWFDRQGASPQRVSINGCTWGGSAIKQGIIAAPGLRLEFGNRVLTTPIRHVRLIRAAYAQSTLN